MNRGCKVLIFKVMSSQHFLNKPLAKKEINNCGLLVSQLPFWLVEILLRVYIIYYQYIYCQIQQFNKNKEVLHRDSLSSLLVITNDLRTIRDNIRFSFRPQVIFKVSHLNGKPSADPALEH